jgi:nucleotide-binding universal stress UspA family protein
MSKNIIAALDNSLAVTPVLATARALADLFGAKVVPVHVSVDGSRVAENAAARAGLKLRTLHGPVLERLLEEARADGVVALVLGARGMPADRRPLGSTAVELATAVEKPVVIVPPEARPPGSIRRALIPVEDGFSETLTPTEIVELAHGTELEVVVLHVDEPTALPAFTDQPQHEHPAWAREFVRRYCPWGIGDVQLEQRVGNAEELVPLVADETAVDIIALGWTQQLAPGRAPIVRAALARAKVPVMLVPVDVPEDQPLTKEEAWSKSPLSLA